MSEIKIFRRASTRSDWTPEGTHYTYESDDEFAARVNEFLKDKKLIKLEWKKVDKRWERYNDAIIVSYDFKKYTMPCQWGNFKK